nr:alpha-ketoglutarate-dependent dioxygenase AlkB [Vibrio sinus]
MFSDIQNQGEWLPIENGLLFWSPNFIQAPLATQMFHQLKSEIQFEQKAITIFGQPRLQPRLQSWHGSASYSYSGLTLTPKPWTNTLFKLKELCENTCDSEFNSVLVNLYRDAQDSMGWHADNEPELGKNPTIASISLGETRTFCLKHTKSKKQIKLDLPNGSLLIMTQSTQHFWQHCLPKSTTQKSERLNLTFRYVLDNG